MKMLLVGPYVLTLLLVSGCVTAPTPSAQVRGIAMHACEKNPFLRSSGLFGGAQPEIFLSGEDVRRESPPAADGLTRVLDVSEIKDLEDRSARPAIDKCASWLQSVGENEVEVTILWRNPICPDSFEFDEEDTNDCRSRASFGFSLEDLGKHERNSSDGEAFAVDRSALMVDAYFVQEIRPERRHPESGLILPERGVVHLVVRLMRASRESIAERQPTASSFDVG
jgi:hypothetical protein